MSKIVVIGANHAGTAAVNTILDTAPDQHQVVVFDANSNISFWAAEWPFGLEAKFPAQKDYFIPHKSFCSKRVLWFTC